MMRVSLGWEPASGGGARRSIGEASTGEVHRGGEAAHREELYQCWVIASQIA